LLPFRCLFSVQIFQLNSYFPRLREFRQRYIPLYFSNPFELTISQLAKFRILAKKSAVIFINIFWILFTSLYYLIEIS